MNTQCSPGRNGDDLLVLIVEDNHDLLRLLVEDMQHRGYRTLAARDGARALHYLQQPIDLLLTDVQLPGICGVEVANNFTSHNPDLAVLYISGASPAELSQTLPAHAPILKKPFAFRDLTVALEQTNSVHRTSR